STSNSDYGNLTGTWVASGHDGNARWQTNISLRPAGKDTWQGEATRSTNVHPCSADYFLLPGFSGSVTVIATGPGVFSLTVRGVIECSDKKGQQFEGQWGGTFTSSQMVHTFREGHSETYTRQ